MIRDTLVATPACRVAEPGCDKNWWLENLFARSQVSGRAVSDLLETRSRSVFSSSVVAPRQVQEVSAHALANEQLMLPALQSSLVE